MCIFWLLELRGGACAAAYKRECDLILRAPRCCIARVHLRVVRVRVLFCFFRLYFTRTCAGFDLVRHSGSSVAAHMWWFSQCGLLNNEAPSVKPPPELVTVLYRSLIHLNSLSALLLGKFN